MGQTTGISWTDHTANFWWGCQRVSPGCEHCYAEQLAVTRRKLPVWGPPSTTERKLIKSTWTDVPKWDRAAARDGVRRRVFVSSMSDIFEDHPQVSLWRARALALLECLTSLDVQLLTKRPENIRAMVPPSWLAPGGWPAHVWVGTTVEDQKRAEQRIPELLKVPARVRFLSCEPLLKRVDLSEWLFVDGDPGHCECEHGDRAIIEEGRVRCGNCGATGEAYVNALSWVIVGGESGPGARPFDIAWARSIVAQCREAGVSVFVKQLGAHVIDRNDAGFDGVEDDEWPDTITPDMVEHDLDGTRDGYQGAPVRIHLRHKKGGDPAEWPRDLRVRQMPGGMTPPKDDTRRLPVVQDTADEIDTTDDDTEGR